MNFTFIRIGTVVDMIVIICQYMVMYCPFCGSNQLIVVNSRPTVAGTQIWRRRRCLKCEGTFTTYEKINLSHLIVIKKSGRRQRYNRAKLYSSVYHSMLDKKNVDRGDASAFAESITNRAEKDMLKMKKKEIYTTEITEKILGILRKKAPDAFLRYLAYREGRDRKKMKLFIKKYFK